MATAGIETATAAASVSRARGAPSWARSALLVSPAGLLFLLFFLVPVAILLVIAFNPSIPGVVAVSNEFTLENFGRIFGRALYYEALVRSMLFGVVSAVAALLLGYPLAYLIAKQPTPGRSTFFMLLVLIAMQLDLIIRMYGLMVLMGDNGLINSALLSAGIISAPLPLMYNAFGVIVGLVQMSLPFMILALIGPIQGIDPSVEEAARGLGAGRWRSFFTITLPLSMPGILSGMLLVFAIAIGSYAVPVLMGGWRVVVTPMHIYQQIAEMGYWQFGAANAALLFGVALVVVFIYHRYTQRKVGGLV